MKIDFKSRSLQLLKITIRQIMSVELWRKELKYYTRPPVFILWKESLSGACLTFLLSLGRDRIGIGRGRCGGVVRGWYGGGHKYVLTFYYKSFTQNVTMSRPVSGRPHGSMNSCCGSYYLEYKRYLTGQTKNKMLMKQYLLQPLKCNDLKHWTYSD